jgi:hypothetical protein
MRLGDKCMRVGNS